MTAAGLIFSNIHDDCIPELTARRTMGSVPFGCRYRLMDFPLSSMVNSGITKVGIIAHNNYQSLLDHVGTGKDWDLARRNGGIKILPPFITTFEGGSSASKLYSTRLEALLGVTTFVNRCSEECLILSDCDVIYNMDFSELLAYHNEKGGQITLVTRPYRSNDVARVSALYAVAADEDGKVEDIHRCNAIGDAPDMVNANILVVNRQYLVSALAEAQARGYRHFIDDIIKRKIKEGTVYAYPYEGLFLTITSPEDYFSTSMALLDPMVREALFNVPYRPIFTKTHNSHPTVYREGSRAVNSYVADGCVIEGTVENSILFRGVRVGKGTVVKNCILFQNTYTGQNVNLSYVVTDKNVMVKDGLTLAGCATMPFYLPKGTMV